MQRVHLPDTGSGITSVDFPGGIPVADLQLTVLYEDRSESYGENDVVVHNKLPHFSGRSFLQAMPEQEIAAPVDKQCICTVILLIVAGINRFTESVQLSVIYYDSEIAEHVEIRIHSNYRIDTVRQGCGKQLRG